MISLQEIKVGDRIKIVDMPPKGSAFTICKNPKECEMGRYLGRVVTVTKVHDRCVSIKEDGGRWAWTPMLIEALTPKKGRMSHENYVG